MMHADVFDTPIEFLKGVGPKRAEILRKELDINVFGDLATHYPFRYIDRSRLFRIADIRDDSSWILFRAKVNSISLLGKPRSQRMVVNVGDDSGNIDLVFFKGLQWFQKKFTKGAVFVIFGKPNVFNGVLNIPHPELETELEYQESLMQSLRPLYSSTEKLRSRGLDSRGLQKLVHTLLLHVKGSIRENITSDLLQEYKLPGREKAIYDIHFPETMHSMQRARARLKFEELFFLQLQILKLKLFKKETLKGYTFGNVGEALNNFYKYRLPFELTGAQKKVIKEIRKDLGSGRQMNRLLQGDVGSGKTMVALMSALIAIGNGFQACIMAPTEILAVQHYNSISRMLGDMNIHISLLTGSTKAAARKEIFNELQEGDLNILIGTHALIEDKVKFKKLGLVIIDEQHRFGVEQRSRLWEKSEVNPHVLVMTATPIPRTLAMTIYGDLDVSVIDELPPGRKAVKTYHFFDKDRLKVFSFMKEQIKKGNRIYVVYPLIHESEALDLKDLMDGYESIVRDFPLPEYAVSIVHGKMKTADKEYEMNRFIKGETQIMVATTVIEVGVDIPEASVMIIENAERFGLSQLHQLRGRVGRGAEQSFCVLMSSYKLTSDAKTRLHTMVETTDGFRISEADLKLRGPGDIQGTRQSGILELKIADLAQDDTILLYARKAAARMLEEDPDLLLPHHRPTLQYLEKISHQNKEWSRIS